MSQTENGEVALTDTIGEPLTEFLKDARRLMGYRYGEREGRFWTEVTDDGNLQLKGYGSANSDREAMLERAQRDGTKIVDYGMVIHPDNDAPNRWLPSITVAEE